jgi:hypothetical protein
MKFGRKISIELSRKNAHNINRNTKRGGDMEYSEKEVREKRKEILHKLRKSEIKDLNKEGSGDTDFIDALHDVLSLPVEETDIRIERWKKGLFSTGDVFQDIENTLNRLEELNTQLSKETDREKIAYLSKEIAEVILIFSDNMGKIGATEDGINKAGPTIPILPLLSFSLDADIIECKEELVKTFAAVLTLMKEKFEQKDVCSMYIISLCYFCNIMVNADTIDFIYEKMGE